MTQRATLSQLAIDQANAASTIVSCLAINDYAPPSAYLEAFAKWTATKAIVEAPQTNQFAWPAKVTPDAIAKAIATEANRRTEDSAARVVAAEAAELASGAALSSLRGWLDEGLERLDNSFRAAAAQFLTASGHAPTRLSGRDDAAQVEAFLARVAAADEMDHLVMRRLWLGQAVHEQACAPGAIWLFSQWPGMSEGDSLKPLEFGQIPVAAADERPALLVDVTRQYQNQRMWAERDAVDRWADLLAVIVPSIARFNLAPDRQATWTINVQNAPTPPAMTALGEMDRLRTLPGRLQKQLQHRITEQQTVSA